MAGWPFHRPLFRPCLWKLSQKHNFHICRHNCDLFFRLLSNTTTQLTLYKCQSAALMYEIFQGKNKTGFLKATYKWALVLIKRRIDVLLEIVALCICSKKTHTSYTFVARIVCGMCPTIPVYISYFQIDWI